MWNRRKEINRQLYLQWRTGFSCAFSLPGFLIFQGHPLAFDVGANQREGGGRIYGTAIDKTPAEVNGKYVHEFG